MMIAIAIALASISAPAPKVMTLHETVITVPAPHVWTCGRPRETLTGGTVKVCQ